jgi:hypothetical protein
MPQRSKKSYFRDFPEGFGENYQFLPQNISKVLFYKFLQICFWQEFTVGGSNFTFIPINVRVLWVSSKQLKTTNVNFCFFDKLIVVDVLIGTLARIYDRNSRYHSVAWKTNLLKPNYVWIMWDVWWYWFQASTGIRSAVVPRNLSRGNLENGSSL